MNNKTISSTLIHEVPFFKTIILVFVFTFSGILFSQDSNVSSFNQSPDRVVGYQNSDFKFNASSFSKSNQHLFGQLSVEERNSIEAEIEPKAVGVVRNLENPISLNLSNTDLRTLADGDFQGGSIRRINNDTLSYTAWIESNGADELRVFVERGYFPNNCKMILFDGSPNGYFQPISMGQINENGFYSTIVNSDKLFIEIIIPISQESKNLNFKISKIVHSEEQYYGINSSPEADCYEDALCTYAGEYSSISELRNSTARLAYVKNGLNYTCTGALVNDTRAVDFQPFLLTANHCFSSQASANSLAARFDYTSTSCNSGVPVTSYVTVFGSNIIATNSATDFTLVLLNDQPAGGREYLGWSTDAISNDQTLHSVHHPAGTFQKYSRVENKTSPAFVCGDLPQTDFLYTKHIGGETAGGSSGSSYVNASNQIVGQLFGTCSAIYDGCDYDSYNTVLGKFQNSYNNNNLQYWLNNGGASVSMSTNPSSSSSFGDSPVGTPITQSIAITNDGTAPNFLNLEVDNIVISQSGASHFTLAASSPSALYLAPGETQSISVIFNPSTAGCKSAKLRFFHNADNFPNPYTITLIGTGTLGSPCTIEAEAQNAAVVLNNFSKANLLPSDVDNGSSYSCGSDFFIGLESMSFDGEIDVDSPTDVLIPNPEGETFKYESSAFRVPVTGVYKFDMTSTTDSGVIILLIWDDTPVPDSGNLFARPEYYHLGGWFNDGTLRNGSDLVFLEADKTYYKSIVDNTGGFGTFTLEVDLPIITTAGIAYRCEDIGTSPSVTLYAFDAACSMASDTATVTVDGDLTTRIDPIVFLQGPLDNPTTPGLMNDDLRANGLIPTTSPYSDGIMTTAPALSVTGADAIVDWVWVELRSSADKDVVIEGRSALLQRDGNIVDIDGISAINFNSAADNYYVLIQHRNHLSILSATAVAVCGRTNVNLSSEPLDVFGGSNAVADMGNGIYALYGGDFNGDGQVLNTDITGVLPSSGTSGYSNSDANMDGQTLNTDIQLIIQPNSGRGIQY